MKGTGNGVPPSNHEYLTFPEFSARVHLKPGAVYKWRRQGKMPPGSVVRFPGKHGYMVDWTVYEAAIRPIP